jgi:hypothetical protein
MSDLKLIELMLKNPTLTADEARRLVPPRPLPSSTKKTPKKPR